MPSTAAGGNITFGVLGEPPTLDPYSDVSSDLTYFLARPVYRSLLRVDPKGTVQGDLVDLEAIEVRGSQATVTIASARWSDGKPVTANDVVRSAARATPPSGFAGLKAEAVGRDRVRFRGEVSNWAEQLAIGTLVTPRGRPLRSGAGPFVVDRYVPGLEVSYVRNPEWVSDRSRPKRITVKFIASLEIMLQLLEDGRLDAAAVPSAVNIDERLDEYGVTYASVLGREVIGLDFENPSPNLRSAVLQAIDRDVIEKGLIRDEGNLVNFTRRINEIGVAPGTEIQLGTAAGDELLVMIQKILQRQLEGDVQSELVTIDPATFYGPWKSSSPLDVALRRETVPGFNEPPLPRGRRQFSMFWVESFLAWNEGVVGLQPNGGLDGPLWNAEVWAKQ